MKMPHFSVLFLLTFSTLRSQPSTIQSCLNKEPQRLAAVCVSENLSSQFFEKAFEIYQKSFKKTYKSKEEIASRYQLFVKSYKSVIVNNLSGKDYTMKVNRFSDLEKEEFDGQFLSNYG